MSDDTSHPPRISSVQLAVLGLTSLTMVVLADFLFWGQPAGWTLGLYGLVLMILLFVHEGRLPRSAPERILAAALAVLFLYSLEQPGTPMLILGVLGLAALGLALRQGWTHSSVRWAWRCNMFVIAGWLAPVEDLLGAKRDGRARRGFRRTIRWILPVALTGMFLGLLALANPILADWLARAQESIREAFYSLPSGWRILTWIAVGIGVWAILRYRCEEEDAEEAVEEAEGILQRIPAAFVVRCLLLFNALFAIQTVLDLLYLWGEAALPNGLTYAEYAHRGSYPLVATALLAGGFTLVTFAERSPSRDNSWARGLVSLWLAQNIFLVLSAGRRLALYVGFYGLSRWRMAAGIWMLLVALGIGYICLRILLDKDNLWLTNVNVVTALVVLYACCFINFDGIIAWHNVQHCHELRGRGAWLDVGYLQDLGPESLPALRWVRPRIEPEDAEKPKVQPAIDHLERELSGRLRNWRGWTWRRQRLHPPTD